MSTLKDNSVYPMQNWLHRSGSFANNKSLVFNIPTIEQPIISNTPSNERMTEIKGAFNDAFISDKAKFKNRTKMRTEAGMAEPAKAASNDTKTPSVDKKGISAVTGANIATGINTIANVATSLYGAKMASKMEPSLISKPADIEPVLIADKTSAIESAGRENIEKSINTARDSYRKAGLTGMDGALLSKENEALNQLSGQLAQYRTNIDAQNAQTTNQFNQFNAATALNVDQANANTLNQFDQYKSSLIGSGIQNASENLRAGTESMFGNMMASAQMILSSINAELETLTEALKAPVTENKNLIAQRDRYNELIRQKQEIESSIFGKPYLKIS